MNIFKKIYCRSFQTVFKIALPFLPYRKPKIVSALSDIPSVLNKKKKSCPIIITDPGIAKLGILSMLTDVFDNAGIEYHVYDKTVANPTTDTVEEALAIYKDNKCDCIIGFGGGSSMDCAKAVGVRIARPKTPLCQVHDKKIFIFSCPHVPAFLIGILPPPVSVRRQKTHEVAPFLPAAYTQKLCRLFCNKTQSA